MNKAQDKDLPREVSLICLESGFFSSMGIPNDPRSPQLYILKRSHKPLEEILEFTKFISVKHCTR